MSVDLPLSSDLQRLLFQRLFESSLSHSSALHQLQDALPMLQKHSSHQFHDLNALGPAVILLQVLSKVTFFFKKMWVGRMNRTVLSQCVLRFPRTALFTDFTSGICGNDVVSDWSDLSLLLAALIMINTRLGNQTLHCGC
jgi:hypothetical protein